MTNSHIGGIMPKQTFFNLTKDKQDRIIDAALTEFASHSFKKATIDNIVSQAQIPKGSFYQYFSDKKDIYKYLFQMISDEKKEVLENSIENLKENSFSDFIRKWYTVGIDYDLSTEDKINLRNHFIHNCSLELREEILEVMIPESNELFCKVLSHYVNIGELKSDINVEVTANMLTTLTVFLGKSLKATTENANHVMESIEEMLKIIEFGIIKEA